MVPSLIHFKERNEMQKILEMNLLVIGGYPVKVYHVVGGSLGAFVAWVLMVGIFAIF